LLCLRYFGSRYASSQLLDQKVDSSQILLILANKNTMGPKKVAPVKKKAGSPEDGGELTPEEKVKMYMLACQSLQVQLGQLPPFIFIQYMW
jgi:hypothetical protein